MTYVFMTTSSKAPEVMSGLLIEAFDVQLSETDVSDISELESRNWDALVTCEYERLEGDLAWSLTVYAAEEVKQRPSETELATLMSQRLDAPVFFASGIGIPWIQRVAMPEGGSTLARVIESDEERPRLAVEAAESSITGFPTLPIQHFPEVVRAVAVPTPVTDAAVPAKPAREHEEIRGLLVNWERLGNRMHSGWPPAGWYSAEMYKEDLELRDRLEVRLRALAEGEQKAISASLSVLDAHYRTLTSNDGGESLRNALGNEVANTAERRWYWHRCPDPLPWTSE
ncbi:hypothetical protein GCM10010277_60980 [Streptomyces longisporoflavus]|uniref:hypothetical protein n=1 Tax=Streptomyces longisporoflavus TaxID=28044 RepID=UPI00167CF528|nr:hypothetical protein [Streptomyces longisporoflavus]GGV58370.1 hypothetical protein GCM10010277_60980 [Streptomyces longisporoflavus]